MIPDYRTLVTALITKRVAFAIVGGIALVLHGSARITRDLGISYGRDRQNLQRLSRALKPFRPTLRGAPAELPYALDAETLAAGLNFTLTTAAGDIDLMGEITGVGMFPVVSRLSNATEIYGLAVQVISSRTAVFLAGRELARVPLDFPAVRCAQTTAGPRAYGRPALRAGFARQGPQRLGFAAKAVAYLLFGIAMAGTLAFTIAIPRGDIRHIWD